MKRLILIPGLLLLCALPSHAVIGHVTASQGFCNGSAGGGNVTGACSAVTTKTFAFTATNANDAITFYIGCGGTTETTVTLTAPSWTITALSGVSGASGSRMASFGAISPNTTAATFTMTWSNSCQVFMDDLVDEFSGADLTGGTTTFEAHTQANNTTGAVTTTVTTVSANDAISGASLDTITAVGAGYTVGANDTQSDWSEWKITTDAGSTVETVNFTGSGTWSLCTVAIKPAAAVTSPPQRTLLGVGK